MMAILLDHTEIYYTGTNLIPYEFYVVNALTLFFFLSGYLFHRPDGFALRHKLLSILRGIFMPYFIFTTVIALPKALAHGQDLDLGTLAAGILTGQASWFVAALGVAELLFAAFLHLTHGRQLPLLLLSAGAFLVSALLPSGLQPWYWQADNALQAMLFLCAGYLYHRHETVFERIDSFPWTVLLAITLILLKFYEWDGHLTLMLWPIRVTSYPVLLADFALSAMLLPAICKRCPPCRMIQWTGAHSIVYYFFCGAAPLLVARLMNLSGFPYTGQYVSVIIAFAMVYALTTAAAWLIYRYIPAVTGRK